MKCVPAFFTEKSRDFCTPTRYLKNMQYFSVLEFLRLLLLRFRVNKYIVQNKKHMRYKVVKKMQSISINNFPHTSRRQSRTPLQTVVTMKCEVENCHYPRVAG